MAQPPVLTTSSYWIAKQQGPETILCRPTQDEVYQEAQFRKEQQEEIHRAMAREYDLAHSRQRLQQPDPMDLD